MDKAVEGVAKQGGFTHSLSVTQPSTCWRRSQPQQNPQALSSPRGPSRTFMISLGGEEEGEAIAILKKEMPPGQGTRSSSWFHSPTFGPHMDWYCSVAQLCPILWDPMNCSMAGFPVLHYHLEFAQTHVH